MSFQEYVHHDGLGLADLVRTKQVSPAEVVEAAIERAGRHNPTLNAIVFEAYDAARAAARQPLVEGPFCGVPFLIKDLGVMVAGWPRTSGSRFAAQQVDTEDSGLMRRYRAAGVIPLGKSNTPEFGIGGVTEGALLGACRNPWDPHHSAGGSSGGAAAAVAAGITPLAHASDGLGSIRIPASCCGLVGLKPTRDRNVNLPDGYDYAQGFVCDHVVSRTVRDSAAMLDATGYPEPSAPYAAPPKTGPYLAEVGRPPGRLRIAWSSETPTGQPIDPAVQAALEATAALLAGLGHTVVPHGLGVDLRTLYTVRLPLSAANFAAGVRRLTDQVGREPEPDDLEPLTWSALNGGRSVTGEAALGALQELRRLGHSVLAAFEDIDVYLSPTLGTPPPPVGHMDPVTVAPDEIRRRQARAFPFTALFNFTGQPSMSLPLAMSANGLPVGMMLTAKYGDEATLFRLAGQLETEAPWKDRHPAIWD